MGDLDALERLKRRAGEFSRGGEAMSEEGRRALEALGRLREAFRAWGGSTDPLSCAWRQLADALEEPAAASPWVRGWKVLRKPARMDAPYRSALIGSDEEPSSWGEEQPVCAFYRIGQTTHFRPEAPGTWFTDKGAAEQWHAAFRPDGVWAEIEAQPCDPPPMPLWAGREAPLGLDIQFATAIRVLRVISCPVVVDLYLVREPEEVEG